MLETQLRGRNIFYRGYVIHEGVRSVFYTIYGPRPQRCELAQAGTFRQSMEWVDDHIAQNPPQSLLVWPRLFAANPLPTAGQ